jgi:hypothetical protein
MKEPPLIRRTRLYGSNTAFLPALKDVVSAVRAAQTADVAVVSRVIGA